MLTAVAFLITPCSSPKPPSCRVPRLSPPQSGSPVPQAHAGRIQLVQVCIPMLGVHLPSLASGCFDVSVFAPSISSGERDPKRGQQRQAFMQVVEGEREVVGTATVNHGPDKRLWDAVLLVADLKLLEFEVCPPNFPSESRFCQLHAVLSALPTLLQMMHGLRAWPMLKSAVHQLRQHSLICCCQHSMAPAWSAGGCNGVRRWSSHCRRLCGSQSFGQALLARTQLRDAS